MRTTSYKNQERKSIWIECSAEGDEQGGTLHITVTDGGCGIEDTQKAVLPFYTTVENDERSGMGFAFMEAFMDELEVESTPGKGTVVHMKKKLGTGAWIDSEE